MARVVFITHGGLARAVDVPPGQTLMEGAMVNRVPGIVARCGGAGGCATCQVYVDEPWAGRVDPPLRDERGTLRYAFDPAQNSRLACKIVMTNALDGIVLRLPPRQF